MIGQLTLERYSLYKDPIFDPRESFGMSLKEKYNQAFVKGLQVDGAVVNESLEYNSVTEWDSIGHMSLIAELEEAFTVSIAMDDIIAFSSYNKGIEIMKKYGVEI